MTTHIKAKQEGVVILTNLDTSTLVGFVYKDPESRKNVFFSASEMGLTEIEELFNGNQQKV